MSVRILAVIVGINHWDDLTFPFWKSLSDHNPHVGTVIVDNASDRPYPTDKKIRLESRVGYGTALNIGASVYSNWDWLLCCNNDCLCSGNVSTIVEKLCKDTVYGNAWKYDYEWMNTLGLPAVVDSAYMLISKKVWKTVGGFDPMMDAAFEEIDYGLRTIQAGFSLAVANLPITHLNLHTRHELMDYNSRWDATSEAFREKYAKYIAGRNHVATI